MDSQTTFFFGATSAQGFHSFYHELYDPHDGWFAYILKGGPGTGKSSIIRAVIERLAAQQVPCERIACSSDPHSLDGAIFHKAKVCIADGTAPHVLEPRFPGAVEETIHLAAYWDKAQLLQNRAQIISLSEKNSTYHKRCQQYVSAAATLKADVLRLSAPHVDTQKVSRYAQRILAKEFPAPNGRIGTESHRFLSAVTPLGLYVHFETVSALCERVYVFEDALGAASAQLLLRLRRYALGNGLDVISCPCPLLPHGAPEHLFVPQLGLCFFTANRYHPADFPGAKQVRTGRFMHNEELRPLRGRLAFTRRAQRELVDEAVVAMRGAKDLHDALEAHYVQAMDFAFMPALSERIAAEILARI